jgi:lysozyme family protein
MDKFQLSLEFTLRWEGGYSNHPNDPGGSTMKGVTQATYNAYRKAKRLKSQDVRKISDLEVRDCYRSRYWTPAGCEALEWPLCLAVFDIAVNAGVQRSKIILGQTTGKPLARAKQVCDARIVFYDAIIARRPKLGVFRKGWLNRTNALRKVAGLP